MREFSELSPQSTEGSAISVLSDGSGTRVVRIIDYGETGRTETAAYLLDSLSMVIWRSEISYDSAISAQRVVQVSDRNDELYLLCDGRLQGADSVAVRESVRRVMSAISVDP